MSSLIEYRRHGLGLISGFRRTAHVLALFVGLLGSLVLLGWVLDVRLLKSITPDWVSMKANTALALLLSGSSLWLLLKEPFSPGMRKMSQVCATGPLLIGLLTLMEYIFSVDLGIDQLLFREDPGAIETSSPGRMAPNTALSFLLLGAAFMGLDWDMRRRHRPAQILLLGPALIALFALCGYLYGVSSLRGLETYTRMAAHTSVGILAISIAGLCSRPDKGFMHLLTASSQGGRLARRFILFTFIVPTTLGWLRLAGERANLYNTPFGTAIFVIATVIILFAGTWLHAQTLHREELRRAEVEEKKLIYEQMVQNAPLGMTVLQLTRHEDPGSFQVVIRNPAAHQVTGIDLAGDVGKTLAEISPKLMQTGIPKAFMEVIKTGKPIDLGEIHYGDDRIPEADFSVKAFPLPGHRVGICFENISVRKEVEAMKERLNQDLARSNDELDRFAYAASHDLKAPLRAVDQLSKWIVEDLREHATGEIRQNVDLLRGRVRRMERMLDDLLNYARVGRAEDKVESIDVRTMIQESLPLMQLPAGFRIEVSPDLPLLKSPRVPLEQVFRNLIDNAVKHHDRTDGVVRVLSQNQGTHQEFIVEDDGPGVPPDFRAKLFQLFQTGRPRDEKEGSGMGLALVKKIVETQGGRISFEPVDQSGRGSRFRFTWPQKNPSPGGKKEFV